jgi:uncharacterized protein YdaL
LLNKGVNAHSYRATFTDPISFEKKTCMGLFTPLPPCSNNAIYSYCVKERIKGSHDSSANVNLSVESGVLSQVTSLLAYSRNMKTSEETPLLVKIPMIKADNLSSVFQSS